MRKFVLVAILALEITFGNALHCYECSSDTNEHCINSVNNETVREHDCRFSVLVPGNPYNSRYQCVAYSKRDDTTGKTSTIRQCVVKNHPREPNFCDSFANDRHNRGCTLLDCKVCEEDYCNSGVQRGATVVVFLGLLGLIGLGKFGIFI